MHSEQKSKELNAWRVAKKTIRRNPNSYLIPQSKCTSILPLFFFICFFVFFICFYISSVVCYTHKYLFNYHTFERLNIIIMEKYEILVVKRQSKTAIHPSTSQNRTVHFCVCFAIPFSIFIFLYIFFYFFLVATLLEFNQLWEEKK